MVPEVYTMCCGYVVFPETTVLCFKILCEQRGGKYYVKRRRKNITVCLTVLEVYSPFIAK